MIEIGQASGYPYNYLITRAIVCQLNITDKVST